MAGPSLLQSSLLLPYQHFGGHGSDVWQASEGLNEVRYYRAQSRMIVHQVCGKVARRQGTLAVCNGLGASGRTVLSLHSNLANLTIGSAASNERPRGILRFVPNVGKYFRKTYSQYSAPTATTH